MSSPPSSADDPREGRAARHVARALALGAVPVLAGLPGLDSLANHHGDETYYAQIAADMLARGDFLVPVYHGRLVLDRAPLFYWLLAGSFRLFGPAVWAARLPSLLAAGVVTALAYGVALRAFGRPRTAVYAALATASCLVLAWLSRLAVPDMVMTVGVFLAAVLCADALAGRGRRRRLVLAGAAIGFAGLVKGHVGLVVAGLPAAAVLALAPPGLPPGRRLASVLTPWLWVPAAVIGGWWYVWLCASPRLAIEAAPLHHDAMQTLGAALLRFLQEEAARQVEGGWRGLATNVREYAIGAVVWFAPWSVYLALGLWAGERPLRAAWRDARLPTAALVLLILGLFGLFTFFILELRSPRYVLPAVPAVGILAAHVAERRQARRATRRTVTAPVAAAAVLLGCATLTFGVALPLAAGPPLDALAAGLRPRLGPADRVIAANLGDSWSTFAMLRLGRPVDAVTDWQDPGRLAASIAGLAAAAPARGTTYLLTRLDTATDLTARAPGRFHLLATAAGSGLVARGGFLEPLALLVVVPEDARAARG